MSKRDRRTLERAIVKYDLLLGQLLRLLSSSDDDTICRTLAVTDWATIDQRDLVSLLAPLSSHSSPQVRQLTALQLATYVGSADDPRALQALVTLAADYDPAVRAAAARSDFIGREFVLTPERPSATSVVERFVKWHHEGQTTVLTIRCPDSANTEQFLAILAGISARQVMSLSGKRQVESLLSESIESRDKRLPDLIVEEETCDVCDLPRRGTPKEVLNVVVATRRVPELLIDP